MTENRGGTGHDHAAPPPRIGVIWGRTPGKLTAKRAFRPC